MKYLSLLLLAQTLVAQDAAKSTPVAPITALDSQNKSILVIDSKARASDYVQAFDFLRKDKPSLKIIVRTSETVLTGVTDISSSAGGTLLLVKVLSNQGLRTQVIPVEQMMEINYSP